MALLRDYHAAIGELVISVLMALELRNALGALTQTWSRLGHEIGFGIGIAHGFASARLVMRGASTILP